LLTVCHFNTSLILAGKSRSLPNREVKQQAPLRQAQALPADIRLGWNLLSLANNLAYYGIELISAVKSFILQATGIMYGFRSKLVCLSKLWYLPKLVCLSKLVCLLLTIEKKLAYYKIYPFPVNYESVMFYITGPGVDVWKRFSSPLLFGLKFKSFWGVQVYN